jgi:hypothetical protein
MEGVRSFKLIPATRRYIPEDSTLHSDRCGNFKGNIMNLSNMDGEGCIVDEWIIVGLCAK